MMQGALKEVCTAFQRYFKGNAQSQACFDYVFHIDIKILIFIK